MNNNLPTEKKQWITPKVEVISKDVVQIGSVSSLAEGVTAFTVFVGSGS